MIAWDLRLYGELGTGAEEFRDRETRKEGGGW